jgi:hypothetical protein
MNKKYYTLFCQKSKLIFGVCQLPSNYGGISLDVINNVCNDMSMIVKEVERRRALAGKKSYNWACIGLTSFF